MKFEERRSFMRRAGRVSARKWALVGSLVPNQLATTRRRATKRKAARAKPLPRSWHAKASPGRRQSIRWRQLERPQRAVGQVSWTAATTNEFVRLISAAERARLLFYSLRHARTIATFGAALGPRRLAVGGPDRSGRLIIRAARPVGAARLAH